MQICQQNLWNLRIACSTDHVSNIPLRELTLNFKNNDDNQKSVYHPRSTCIYSSRTIQPYLFQADLIWCDVTFNIKNKFFSTTVTRTRCHNISCQHLNVTYLLAFLTATFIYVLCLEVLRPTGWKQKERNKVRKKERKKERKKREKEILHHFNICAQMQEAPSSKTLKKEMLHHFNLCMQMQEAPSSIALKKEMLHHFNLCTQTLEAPSSIALKKEMLHHFNLCAQTQEASSSIAF